METDVDYTPVSTLQQVEDFIKFHPVWRDIQMELKIWLSEIHMQLENLDGELSHRALDRLGGSAEAIRNLSNFPDILLVNLRGDKESKSNK